MRSVLISMSSILALISYIVYVVAIVRGDARPHRTTRFCTALITVLAMASLFAQGSTSAVWLSVVFAGGSCIIFALSLWRGMGGWSASDILCLLTSVAGVLFWNVTNDPLLGLIFFIGADFVGQLPMLFKTYRLPHTEVWTFYFLDVMAALCTLAAAGQWSASEVAYPLYVVALDASIIYLITGTAIAKAQRNMR